MNNQPHDPSLLNRRMCHELRRLGYDGDVSVVPLASVSARLLVLMTDHHDRVMRSTPAGLLQRQTAERRHKPTRLDG